MQATTSTYLKTKLGTRLFAAALALAGSGTMVGGSLGIAEHYASNAGAGHPLAAMRGRAPGQLARNSCPDKAS